MWGKSIFDARFILLVSAVTSVLFILCEGFVKSDRAKNYFRLAFLVGWLIYVLFVVWVFGLPFIPL